MINFKTFITELFQGSNIFKWTLENARDPLLASFEVKDYENYFVAINQRTNPGNVIEYNVAFSRGVAGANRDRAMGISGEFDTKTALRVYNTVIDILRTKLKPYMNTGDSIVFESYDPRTAKLYSKFSQMIAKEIGGKVARSGNTFTVYKTFLNEDWVFGSNKLPSNSMLESPFPKFDALSLLRPTKYMWEDKAKLMSVPVKSLYTWQRMVETERITGISNNYEPIKVNQVGGKLVIMNGNHRATAAYIQGMTHIKAYVANFDDEKAKKYWKDKSKFVSQPLAGNIK